MDAASKTQATSCSSAGYRISNIPQLFFQTAVPFGYELRPPVYQQ
jgi:hypothetical protein